MSKIERGSPTEPHRHLDASARHLDAPLLLLDLPAELEALRRTKGKDRGHVAKTLVKHADLRVVLIAFERGGRLDEHQAPGRVCIQVVEGQLAVRVGEQTVQLQAGGLLELGPSIPHEVEALADSALLLTIAWPRA